MVTTKTSPPAGLGLGAVAGGGDDRDFQVVGEPGGKAGGIPLGYVFADGDEDVIAFVLGGEPRNGKQQERCKRCNQPFHRCILLANTEPKTYLCERMDVKLVTVGRTDVQWVKDGLDLYVSRLKHYVPFSVVEIPQLKNVSAFSQEQIKEKEGELILKQVAPGDAVVLLDERGKEYRSVEWAEWIRQRLARGGKSLVFVIGGAYGFSRKVYERAEGLVSLSRMTFSHQMVRTIFAEQLYRAFTIIKGEPYHHE